MKQFISLPVISLGLSLVSIVSFAQGIPEPGIVLYGKILASDGITSVPATSVQVELSSIGQVVPAEVTRGNDGFHYYVASFPFESVLPGKRGSASIPDLPPTPQTYELGTGTLVEAEGGRSLNPTASEQGGSVKSFEFGGDGVRGALFRMDLVTSFVVESLSDYESWANEFFGNSEGDGAPGADPDGDGHVNEFERIAGLDPTSADPGDPMSRFVLEVMPDPSSPDGMLVSFRPKVPGRSYEVRRSPSLGEAQEWQVLSPDLQQESTLPGAPEGVAQVLLQDAQAPSDQGFYDVQIEIEP